VFSFSFICVYFVLDSVLCQQTFSELIISTPKP